MKALIAATILAVLAVGPAMAAGATCSTAPQAKWKPQSDLEHQLTAAGLKVVQIKSENGCYEVYTTDQNGKRVNTAYNAQTLEPVENAEAGEQ